MENKDAGLVKIAERLKAVLEEYDPYGCKDAELDVQMCLDNIKVAPVDTIEYLVTIIEDLMEDKEN